MERVTSENQQLNEKLKMQEWKVAQYKTMANQNQIRAEGQNLKALTVANLVQPPFLTPKFVVEL